MFLFLTLLIGLVSKIFKINSTKLKLKLKLNINNIDDYENEKKNDTQQTQILIIKGIINSDEKV